MAEPKTKKLDIEDKLGSVEQKKDFQALKEITDNLPSSAKIRIYKIDDTGTKKFISTYAATDFDSANPHEWIKSKFYSKHKGGEYRIELVDSEGKAVGGSTIDLIDEEGGKDHSSSKHIELMGEALTMREEAAGKIIEANTALHEVEKAKAESTMELMSRQWDAMGKIYESRIADLSNKKDSSTDPMMQMIFQRELENMKRDMERDKERFLSEIKSKDESKSGNDRVIDLLTSMVLNKKEENPIDNISKTMELMTQLTGGGGDTIDDIMANPMKMEMFKKMMGIADKKDFFEELMSNPMKAEMFKKILGVEEKKKDLISEVMENPEKFKMVQRMLGLPTAEDISRNSVPPIQPEPKKDFLETMMDMTTKLAAAKPILTNMLGIESRPVANLMELAGNIMNGAMPHIADSIKTVSNNMVTAKLIEKGFVMGVNGALIPIEQFRGGSQPVSIHKPREVEVVRQPSQPQTIEQPQTIKEDTGVATIEEKFKKMLAGIIVESGEGIEAPILVDKMSDAMVAEFKNNPMIIMQIMRYGDKLDGMMAGIIKEMIGVDESISLALAGEISRVTREKAGA